MTAWTFNCLVFASKFDAMLNIGSSGLSIPTRLSLLLPRLENINKQLPSDFIKKISGNSYLILFYLELFCCCCCSLNLRSRSQSIFKNIDTSFLFQEWFREVSKSPVAFGNLPHPRKGSNIFSYPMGAAGVRDGLPKVNNLMSQVYNLPHKKKCVMGT